MGDTAYILHPEYCDLCKSQGLQVQAVYDGKTVHGPWAYMCEEHFGAMGVGLGTGRGQRLIVGTKPSSGSGIKEVDDEDATDETIDSSADEPSSNGTLGSDDESTNQEGETTVSSEEENATQDSEIEQAALDSDSDEESSNGVPHPKKLDWGNLYP